MQFGQCKLWLILVMLTSMISLVAKPDPNPEPEPPDPPGGRFQQMFRYYQHIELESVLKR